LLPEPGTSPTASYVWKPADSSFSVQLQFDVVDRILLEVMRGFGAVPKRGAEVGGILLGTAETVGGRTIVTVEDFEAVECDHAAGPSYILSQADRMLFGEAVERWKPGSDRRIYAVGYYRGHTRDGICLATEDLRLLDELFPSPSAIALVIKPYATKVSMAGIFYREEGAFRPESSRQEFPFRRKELGGGSTGIERLATAARFGQQRVMEDPRFAYAVTGEAMAGAGMPGPATPGGLAAGTLVSPEGGLVAPAASGLAGGLAGGGAHTTGPVLFQSDIPAAAPLLSSEAPKAKGVRGGWVWIPLSFIFMLLGVVVGFQIALSMRPKQPANPWLEAWDMAFQVKRTGEELSITWDPLSPAVRNASRGALIIQSREETRTIDLRGTQLQGGSVVYRGVPDRVIFRLEVYPRERVVVSEIAEFKRE
jgi:hypothetical protein